MVKKIIAIIFIFSLISISYSNDNVLKINELKGEKKWEELRNLIIKVQKWYTPPNFEFEFKANGTLLNYGYNIKSKFYKIGKWDINIRKGYFYILVPNLYIKGFWGGLQYKSFNISCFQDVYGIVKYDIIFYKEEKFVDIQESEEFPEGYFILSM